MKLLNGFFQTRNISVKHRNRLLFVAISVVAISLGFASCSIFGRSKSRQYSLTDKQAVSPAGSGDAETLFGTKRADVRPLKSQQVRNLMEDAFSVQLSDEVFDSKLNLTVSGEFNEPSADAAFEPFRLEAIYELAVVVSLYIAENSKPLHAILEKCGAAQECARNVYDAFAPKLLKFPIAQETADQFTQGMDFSAAKEIAVRQVLARMLASPRLWNLISVADSADPKQANADTTIWRTALFAWNGAPASDAFANPAKKGSKDWAASVFEDPKFDAVWQEFVTRWLGLDVLDQQTKNADLYPSELLKNPAAFRVEIVANAARILRENRDIRTLLHSEDWTVPDALKAHYAVQGPDAPKSPAQTPEAEKLAQQRRTGYLSSAAFAAITSGPYSSKTTSRGHFVMKKFLCEAVPPPPAGAGTFPEELANRQVTAREKAEIHAKVEPCATCHRLMDPIGFLLEPLNPVGRFRADYAALNAAGFKYGDLQINPAIEIAIGRSTEKRAFHSIEELGRRLSTDDQVAACIVRKFVQFASGSAERETDRREVQAILRQFAGQPLSPKRLGFLITQLPSFRGMEAGIAKGDAPGTDWSKAQ